VPVSWKVGSKAFCFAGEKAPWAWHWRWELSNKAEIAHLLFHGPQRRNPSPCPAEIPAWAGWKKDSQIPQRTLREKAGHCTSLLCIDYIHC